MPDEAGVEVSVATDEERLGDISLGISIAGLVFPVFLARVFAVLLEWNILRGPGINYALCLLLGGVIELAALGCGLGARRTTAGKTGLFISLASLLLLVLVLAFTVSTLLRRRPVQQEVAPAAQP
jgi:hypothetical protein